MRLAAGKQPFVLPGLSLQEEMRLFAEAGVGVEQVWKLALARAFTRAKT